MTDAPDGSRVPVKGPISDFARINWNRAVTIVFDSNIHTNRNVYWERIHLAKYLRDKPRRASVSFVDIPAEEGINGVDDLIAAWGKDRVLELVTERAYDSERQKNSVDRDELEGSFRRPNWPNPLDPAAFYGLAGEITRTIEPHSESDPAALLVQFLVAFGNLIGRRAHFRAEADRHFLNLFTVIVGQTSKGRKGSSLGQVQSFLQSVDSKWSLERIISGLSTGEGLIWAVRDPVYKSVPVREGSRITGCEEVMEDKGIDDKRLLCQEPEFGRLLQASERKENTLSAVLRQCWDTGDLHTLTRNQAARATHAHISVIGHITKDELRRLLTDTAKANGFCNRFLWTCAKRSKLLPEGGELHKVNLDPITRKLAHAVAFAGSVGQMERDATARSLWAEVYPELSEGKPGLFGAVTSRAESITMRLACLYALLDSVDLVRAEHLRAALAVWRYCESSAQFIFGDSIGDETADEVLWVLRSTPAGMSRTDLRDHFQRNKRAEEITRALVVLQELGMARMDKKQHDGSIRPTETWFAV